MGFREDLNNAQKVIDQDYQKTVIATYVPIFNNLMEKAKKHMKENQISKINLNIKGGLVYTLDGFREGQVRIVDLLRVGRLFQKNADYIAGCADSRSHRTPLLDEALRTAAISFKDQIIESISDTM